MCIVSSSTFILSHVGNEGSTVWTGWQETLRIVNTGWRCGEGYWGLFTLIIEPCIVFVTVESEYDVVI